MTSLSIQNAAAGYGHTLVLRDVSLEIPEGEVVCLLGANGAGKTTLIRVLSGLLPLKSGSIKLGGDDISRLDPISIVSRGVATVPEGRRIFPDLTVRENLQIGAYHRRRSYAGSNELDFAFEMFPRLKERADQMGGTLSGGEQQMLAIGRALMSKPKTLLLDEPSMGLAPILIQAVFETIAQLSRTGITILLVEQNAAAALDVASHGYVLDRGEIALRGRADDLKADPRVQESYLGLA
jgi:branched-chain amino acid transport system ATP-binding protein